MATLSADGTKILNNYDRFTGVPFNATKVDVWKDGTPMDDSKVDNFIYFKNKSQLGGGYCKRDFDNVINVKWFGAKGDSITDDTVAIHAALRYANGRPIYLPSPTKKGDYYILSQEYYNPGVALRIYGESMNSTYIRASTTFQGKMFRLDNTYDIRNININGNTNDLENTDIFYGDSGGAGNARMENVSLNNCNYGINFTLGFQHPLIVNYSNVIAQDFRTCGVSIGRKGSTNGESTWMMSNVVTTNSNQVFNLAANLVVTQNSDGTTSNTSRDYLTWNTIPGTLDFGYVISRRLSGSTNINDWVVPTNFSFMLTANTFVANKTAGEVWEYRVSKMTVGLYLGRGKALTISGQWEYTPIGIFIDQVNTFNITHGYGEVHAISASHRPAYTFGYINLSHGTVTSGWSEGFAYSFVTSDSDVSFIGWEVSDKIAFLAPYKTGPNSADYIGTSVSLRNSNAVLRAYPKASGFNNSGEFSAKSFSLMEKFVDHTTQSKLGARYRGTEKASITADTLGGILNSNLLNVVANKKALSGSMINTNQTKSGTSAASQDVIQLTLNNAGFYAGSLNIPFELSIVQSVVRQSISGILNLNYVVQAPSVYCSGSFTLSTAIQAGTVSDFGFDYTSAVVGGNIVLTVSCQFTSSLAASTFNMYMLANYQLGSDIISISIL